MKRKKRILLLIILAALLLCAAVPLILNAVVIGSTKGQIHEITPEDGYETALILGAKVHADGTLSGVRSESKKYDCCATEWMPALRCIKMAP